MKIVDLLKVDSIDLKAQPKDKAAALEHLITLMERRIQSLRVAS